MTSLETLYCLKEFRIADIPLSGVSGVMGAVRCVMCAEVDGRWLADPGLAVK